MAKRVSARRRGRAAKTANGAGSAGATEQGSAFDVGGLRRRLGEHLGTKKLISRKYLATLLGAAEGSILNWEKGKVPNAKYTRKLVDLEQRAASGQLGDLSPPKRGGRPRKDAAYAGTDGAHSSRGRGRDASRSIAGDAPVVYANQVSVERGAHDARIRFALALPGESGARAISDVVVPLEILSRLGV